jgi:hypothetical protein
VVTYSTLAAPGATIISGAGISSFTWTPQIFSTWTYFITFASTVQALDLAQNTTIYSLSIATASTFLNLQSTGVSLSQNWMSTISTWNAFVTFGSTTQSQVSALISTMTAVGISTQNVQSQITTLNSTMTVVRLATSTIETTLSQRTVIGYNGGSALSGGNITAIIAGTNMTASQSGSTMTFNASASGGGNTTWYFVQTATAPSVYTGFSINYATAVIVGTQPYNGAAIAVSTTPDSTKPLLSMGTGTLQTYDFMIASFTSRVPVIVGTEPATGFSITDGFVTSVASMSIQRNGGNGDAGGISAATYTVRGTSIFFSTYSTRGYDGFTLGFTSGTIPANTTVTFTAGQELPFSVIGIPVCETMKGAAAPTLPVYLEDTLTATSFQITNSDITNRQKFTCLIPGRMP